MSETASTASNRVPLRPGRSRPTASTASPSIRDAVADAVSGRGQKENCVPDVVEVEQDHGRTERQPLFPPVDWEARLRAAVDETVRKRQAKTAARHERHVRRLHGLAARHAAKLARNAMTKGIGMNNAHTIGIDASALSRQDLNSIGRVLTRSASSPSVSPNVAIALGLLADQASKLARTKIIGGER